MEINTIEQLNQIFDTEDKAVKYLSSIRWGEWAHCPYCGNVKAYFIEKGKRYKCANPECYKKFSVTTNTLLHGSNISIKNWLTLAFVYSKKIGRGYSWDLQNAIKCTATTSSFCQERLHFAWQYVEREGKTKHEMFVKLLKCLCDHGSRLEEFKKIKYNNHFWHISDIDNIGNPRQYDRLVRYAESRMIYCEWIYLNFASGEDVLSEVLLWMSDNKVKEYNADSMVKMINNTIQRMWMQWVDAHPNVARRYRERKIQWKRDARLNLKPYYLVQLMKSTKKYKEVSTAEIRSDKIVMKEYKERLKARRDKLHQLYDWHSHFE